VCLGGIALGIALASCGWFNWVIIWDHEWENWLWLVGGDWNMFMTFHIIIGNI
jgi:hypothetical protein